MVSIDPATQPSDQRIHGGIQSAMPCTHKQVMVGNARRSMATETAHRSIDNGYGDGSSPLKVYMKAFIHFTHLVTGLSTFFLGLNEF